MYFRKKVKMSWLEAITSSIKYIEMYTDASKYPKGTADENYYTEIWIPVKAK